MAYGMDTVAVNPVAVSAALAGTTITVKLGGLGPGGVTLKENKLGFEALGTDGLWHSTPVTGKAADSVTVGPAPAGAKAVRYLWYSSPCSPYKGQPQVPYHCPIYMIEARPCTSHKTYTNGHSRERHGEIVCAEFDSWATRSHKSAKQRDQMRAEAAKAKRNRLLKVRRGNKK